MINPLLDYFYRFPQEHIHNLTGRCRVRIYKRKNGSHVVLLTELDTQSGESITSACERIATDLAATKKLNAKSTRWIQHDPPHADLPPTFDEIRFTWDSHQTATDPQWQRLDYEKVEALTGESLNSLNRRLGDVAPAVK